MNEQIKDIQNKINELEKNKKLLKHSMNPFNENFNINRETTLMKINSIDEEILKFQQDLEKILTTSDFDINSINSEQFIEIQYGKKSCPSCTIL
ncbi:hypothetical protein [Spiroplasma endosymbiont of Lasioglossum malachurum]|uniref:hypothetical protein n=1 Tax=Spiroplasma endosymbiont of Lasioglossum malachurum TaxID=3066319 RepID=UPI0030D39478